MAIYCKKYLKAVFNLEYSDDSDEKSGFKKACRSINEELSVFFKGKELPLSKKTFENFESWLEKRQAGRS